MEVANVKDVHESIVCVCVGMCATGEGPPQEASPPPHAVIGLKPLQAAAIKINNTEVQFCCVTFTTADECHVMIWDPELLQILWWWQQLKQAPAFN